MRSVLFLVTLVALGAHSLANEDPASTDAIESDAQVDFLSEVRPLLSDRCFSCHGPDTSAREADLRVDDFASLIEDRGDYQIVLPGDPSKSELIRRITSADSDEIMPPHGTGKPLTTAEKRLLQQWVQQGANWQQHWAYLPPAKHPTPAKSTISAAASPPRNWIDLFIGKSLVDNGGEFSPPANMTTLARRLTFDLTGLPPTPEMIEAIVSHKDSDAVVDAFTNQLLASPAFGERLAIYWLDLVRYADTVGYHGDQDHSISPYRDYVIDSFNDNKPFDQFTVEQLAGDLLESPTEEQILATGYNRLLQTSHEGGVQPQEYLTIYAADRVRNVSAVWMGATVGCAQCHDHKYDPYTSRDFYALSAFFADIDEAQHFKVGSNALPTRRPPETSVLDRRARQLLARAEHELQQLNQQRSSLETEAAPASEPCSELVSDHSDELSSSIQRVQERIKAIKKSARMCMITKSIQPRETRFLPRGNWLDNSGEILQPAIPQFLGSLESDSRLSRLDFARWLVDEKAGAGLMTARVFVNRLWLLMFGSGLSTSVDDFGGQGNPPDHPELLDELAIEFVRSGWDIKHIVRLIASSATYRQSSLETQWHRTNDPENRRFSRQNRFRIAAEVVRDTSLACGNLLIRDVGGASTKPYQPEGYYQHLNFPTRKYQHSKSSAQWRRGIYVHWQRQFLHPMLRAFDAPTREECTAQRPESNTPLAALVWLNDPSFIEAARGLANRVLSSSKLSADEDRISHMFFVATSRAPDAAESQLLADLLQSSRQQYADDPIATGQLETVGILQLPAATGERSKTDTAEMAAWTTVARAVLNLNETYTRN